MDWLFPAVISTLAATVVLALTYAYLYYRDREISMGIWTMGWMVYVFRFVCMLLMLPILSAPRNDSTIPLPGMPRA